MIYVEAAGIALVIALIIAFIATSSLRAELKSVQTATEANIYIQEGSFKLSNSQDIYVATNLEKKPKPKPQQQGQATR